MAATRTKVEPKIYWVLSIVAVHRGPNPTEAFVKIARKFFAKSCSRQTDGRTNNGENDTALAEVTAVSLKTSLVVQLNRHLVCIAFSHSKAKFHQLKAQVIRKISKALSSYQTLLFIYKLFTHSLPN